MPDNRRQQDREVVYAQVGWRDEPSQPKYVPGGDDKNVHPETYQKTLQEAHCLSYFESYSFGWQQRNPRMVDEHGSFADGSFAEFITGP
jgi:hypothetical protein